MRVPSFIRQAILLAGLLSGTGLSYAQISVQIVETQSILCQGSSIGALQAVISPAGIGGTLQWSNGSSASQINGLSAGDYSVTFTDVSGGQYSDTHTLVEPQAISITSLQIFPLKVFSTGDILVDVSGGAAPYFYEWKNQGLELVSTEQDLLGAAPGVYVLELVDANGCRQSFGPVEIQLIQPITASIEIIQAIRCNGDFNGELLAIHNSSSLPVTYAWSSGHSSPEVFNAGAGVYTVTITDADGASAVATVQLEEPDVLVASTQQSFPMPVQTTADILVDIEGGTSPYTYRWENADAQEISTEEDLLAAGPGVYTLFVTDAHDCETTLGPLELVFTSGLQDAADAGILLYPNPAGFYLNIEMPEDGLWTYTLIDAAGRAIHRQAISTAEASIDLSAYASGVYQLQLQCGNEMYIARIAIQGTRK